ncbi:MAG: sensor histidine kinase [Rhodobacteraceae bacterium]|nr:sensor histidine kinase [Paracoccaceae bacterium]
MCLLLNAPVVRGQALCPVLDLTGPMRTEALMGHINALQDPTRARSPAELARPDAPGFALLDGTIPDFGYTKSKIWLRLCLRNQTDISDWRLYVHENFFQVFDVHLAHPDGTITTVVKLVPDSPFAARPIPDPEMIAPLNIQPNKTVTLLIGYRSGGASQMNFSLETRDSFTASAIKRTTKNSIFYGMMLLLIAVALFSLLVFRHMVFLAYSSYAAAALLFVMHGDGTAFQYLWPTLPGLNSNASVFTGGGLIVSGAAYARVFLQTRIRHPYIDKLLWGLIALTCTLIATLLVPNPQILKKLLIMLSLFSVLVFTASGLISYFSGHKEVRFYALAWFGAVLSSGLMNLRHVVGLEIPQEVVHDSIRVVMVLDAMMMGLAIADRYNQMRRGRQAALEDNLVATRQRLELNRRLADLQARLDLAAQLAKSRDRHIQNVVHDLRQPLHALRLTVMNLTAEGPTQDSTVPPQSVEAAFTYLETLIGEHLEPEPGNAFSATPPAPPPVGQDETLEPPGLQAILGAVTDMFQPDATAKGLGLRHVPSRIDMPVAQALVLTRIVSNLISNAIKYTDSGGVLIGTRRRGASIRIEVHDTGPGMTHAEFTHAVGRNVRLERSRRKTKGKGLGLAIAIDLAARNNMRIERLETRGTGTGLAIVIPA